MKPIGLGLMTPTLVVEVEVTVAQFFEHMIIGDQHSVILCHNTLQSQERRCTLVRFGVWFG